MHLGDCLIQSDLQRGTKTVFVIYNTWFIRLGSKLETRRVTVRSHRTRRERQSGRKSFILNESRRRERRVLDDESVEESWNQVNFMVMSYDAVRRQPIRT